MRCDGCANWVLERVRTYDDGTRQSYFKVYGGKGLCEHLNMEVPPDFGCVDYQADKNPEANHVRVEEIKGAAWQHWHMGACPDCHGRGCGVEGGACRRCCGGGKVRVYDDGFIGDEQTRKHKVEIEQERMAEQERRRAAAEAILAGLPPPPSNEQPVFDGRALAHIDKSDGVL